MRLHNKFIMLTAEIQALAKENKFEEIPEELRELASEWLEKLQGKKEEKIKPVIEEEKELDNG
jgi:hypothetical protein